MLARQNISLFRKMNTSGPAGLYTGHGNHKSYKQGANLKDEAKTSSRAYTQGTLKRTLFLVYLAVLPGTLNSCWAQKFDNGLNSKSLRGVSRG